MKLNLSQLKDIKQAFHWATACLESDPSGMSDETRAYVIRLKSLGATVTREISKLEAVSEIEHLQMQLARAKERLHDLSR